jgi:protein-L-isoaspartate O-methyltransferase
MVIPVGGSSRQTLTVITRHGEVYERENLESVSFVPLVGGGGD